MEETSSQRCATMEERESKRFTKILRTVGEEGALKRVPWESGRWAQNSAGPVVPAQGAVLPPQVKPAPTALFGSENPQDR